MYLKNIVNIKIWFKHSCWIDLWSIKPRLFIYLHDFSNQINLRDQVHFTVEVFLLLITVFFSFLAVQV